MKKITEGLAVASSICTIYETVKAFNWPLLASITVLVFALAYRYRLAEKERATLAERFHSDKLRALYEIQNRAFSDPSAQVFRPNDEGRPLYDALVNDGFLIHESGGYRLKPPPPGFRTAAR